MRRPADEAKEKFVIAVRIRPTQEDDLKSYKPAELEPIVSIDSPTTIAIQRKNSEEKIFRFNHILMHESQDDIYEKSAHLVNSVFEGHNATFLAYGQTGTGKTHTIFGSKDSSINGDQRGYFHRAVLHIFSKIK